MMSGFETVEWLVEHGAIELIDAVADENGEHGSLKLSGAYTEMTVEWVDGDEEFTVVTMVGTTDWWEPINRTFTYRSMLGEKLSQRIADAAYGTWEPDDERNIHGPGVVPVSDAPFQPGLSTREAN